MWWRAAAEPSPEDEAVLAQITRYYEAVAGIESFWLGALLAELGLIDEPARVKLPAEGAQIAMQGPEDRLVVMTADVEDGVCFHFSMADTPPAYLLAFWTQAVEMVGELRREIRSASAVLAGRSDEGRLAKWRSLAAMARPGAGDADFGSARALGVIVAGNTGAA